MAETPLMFDLFDADYRMDVDGGHVDCLVSPVEQEIVDAVGDTPSFLSRIRSAVTNAVMSVYNAACRDARGRFAKCGSAPGTPVKATPAPEPIKPVVSSAPGRPVAVPVAVPVAKPAAPVAQTPLPTAPTPPTRKPAREPKKPPSLLQRFNPVALFRDYVIPNNSATKNPILKPIAKVLSMGYSVLNGTDKLVDSISTRRGLGWFAGAVHGTLGVAAGAATISAMVSGGPAAAVGPAAWLVWETLLTASQIGIMQRLGKLGDRAKKRAEAHAAKLAARQQTYIGGR